MKRIAVAAILAVFLAALFSCSSGLKVPEPAGPTDSAYDLTLSFARGAASTGNIIYVAWIEDSNRNFVRYIYTCERLLNNSSKPNIPDKDTCPFWRIGLYDTTIDDAVDVVSGATKTSQDFAESISIPAGSPSRFTVYFEYDRSFDGNDWWSDQPAILYAADVDLSSGPATKAFTLAARGWSRNAGGGSGGNTNEYSGNPAASAIGALQADLRYVTNHAASGGTAFGAAYDAGSEEDATNMVGSITLTATKK